MRAASRSTHDFGAVMDFRIADTFTASLARLNGAEQKAVKTTAFDLQLNLSSPGLRFHRLERPRYPNFWSFESLTIAISSTRQRGFAFE